MVVKIQSAAASVSRAVDYNEEKVAEGSAQVIFSSNINDLKDIMASFAPYENAARARNLSFHTSFNPSEEDLKRMSQEDVKNFIKEWMARMGYGNQPYIIYEHDDIGRKHYHVVSIRSDIDGKKIDEWQERKRSLAIIKELAEKYKYKVGRDKTDNRRKMDTIENVRGQKDIRPVERFNPDNGPVAQQIERLASNAMAYHFTTMNQYVLLMREMGVQVDIEEHRRGKIKMYYSGIDSAKREVCTVRIESRKLKVAKYDEIKTHNEECKSEVRRKEKIRVGRLASFCLKHSTSKLHYDRMLRKQNIVVKYSFDANDKLMGATYIDHQTRCVFKASELKKHLKLEDIDTKITKEWPKFDHSDKVGDKPQEVSNIDRKVEKLAEALAEISMDALGNSPKGGKDKKRTKEAQVHKRTYHG